MAKSGLIDAAALRRLADAQGRLWVRATPRAAADAATAGEHDGRPVLLVRVTAPPDRGAANDAILALVARALGVAKGEVRLLAGESARMKRLQLPDG